MNNEDTLDDRPKDSSMDDYGSGEDTAAAEEPVNDGGGAAPAEKPVNDGGGGGDPFTDP